MRKKEFQKIINHHLKMLRPIHRQYNIKLSIEDIKILYTVYSFKLSSADLFSACAEFVNKK